MAEDQAKLQRYARVAGVFTPGAPIDRLALFAGRVPQILDVINAVGQRGQHVVLYGERGVGKTSLANVLSDIFADQALRQFRSAKVNCTTDDNYVALWRKVFRELELPDPSDEGDWRNARPTPEDVRWALQRIDGPQPLIVIDELDRLEDDDGLSLLADTIKTLSDNSVPATLVLVGVADSIEQLVGDHRSVERALAQVQMPRMSLEELEEIISKGLEELGMSIDPGARDRIAKLSEGLPHYTHLLALHATQRAVMDDRGVVSNGDVDEAVALAVSKAQQSIQSDYQKATRSPRSDSLFGQVLLACALSPKDDLGYFTAGGVREPMSQIMGRRYDIPAFARHLNEFTLERRGSVLEKRGEARRFFYRFSNPLLQPFVVLSGLSRGLVSQELIDRFQPQGPENSPRE